MLNEDNLKFIKKKYVKHTANGLVSKVGFIYEDDSTWKSDNTACHAGLYGAPKGKPLKGVWSVYKQPNEEWTEEGQKQFVDWMVNRSPYAESFLLKDVDTIMKGCWVSDPNHRDDLVVGGSIATRFISEGYYRGNGFVWQELVKNGADETNAYIFAQTFGAINDGLTYPITVSPGDHHTSINFSSLPIQVSKNFINNNRLGNRPNYQDSRTYTSLNRLFNSGQYKTIEFREWAKAVKPIKKRLHMSYNIFDQGKKKINVISDADDLMSVYEQFTKEMAA